MAVNQRTDRIANTTQEMIEAQRKTYEALTDSFIESQKRGVRFAQSGTDLAGLGEENTRAVRDFWASSARLMGLGQRNAQFFQSWMTGGADYLRNQVEHNQRAAEAIAESARAQREGLRKLGEDWVGVSQELASTAQSTTRSYAEEGAQNARQATQQGLQAVQETAEQADEMARLAEHSGTNGSDLPIRDYDNLSVNEASQRLGDLSGEQLEKIRAYEKQNKNRDSLLEQIERKINKSA